MKHQKFDELYPYGYFLVRKSDGMKYVGIRYANVKYNLTPNEDFGREYFTSGRLKEEFKNNPSGFYFKLKHTFDTIEELFEWERRIALRIYKRPDWANQGWGQNYGDNPNIGELISEGRLKVKKGGRTSAEIGAEKLREWIWNTPEGEQWREDISKRIKAQRASYTPEKEKEIQAKRKAKMDFYSASKKASETMRGDVDENGLNMLQRKARKGAETRKKRGVDSELGKKRDAKYTKKLGEMSEEEFELWCSSRDKRTIAGAITRRNKYLNQIRGD